MNPTKTIRIRLRHRARNVLQGLFGSLIPYEIRNPLGDWSPYFGQYESQRHDDIDTNCCWAFAGNECMEDSLEFLWKTNRMSQANKDWFQANGYIDSDGDFYLSRRFIPTLSGVTNTGNDQSEFWRLTRIYGAIPDKLLPYTNNQEYFDKSKITPAMYALGKEFLKRISIQYQEGGKRFARKDITFLKRLLLQGELQIGIPIPVMSYLWNAEKVDWDGGTQAAHSLALYKIDEGVDGKDEYPYYIYDQYSPMLKRLSRDYFIPIVTQLLLTEIPQVAPTPVIISSPLPVKLSLGAQIWFAIMDYFKRIYKLGDMGTGRFA